MMTHMAPSLRFSLFSAVLALLASLSPGPVQAQMMQGSPIRAEVLSGWVQPDGTRIAGLRMTLAPGWKTYWRAPGDAGIPPSFDWSGSTNLRSVGVSFPTPTVFELSGLRSIGYFDMVILPLKITPLKPGEPIQLEARVELGVCKDVCLPETLHLSERLDDANRTVTPAIAAAIADRPATAREAGVRGVNCALTPLSNGIRLEATLDMPSAGEPEIVVVEPGNPSIWASETTSRRKGGKLVTTGELANASGTAMAIDRSALRFTVLGSKRAVDIRGCGPAS